MIENIHCYAHRKFVLAITTIPYIAHLSPQPSPGSAMQVQRAPPTQMMQPTTPGHVPSPVGQSWGRGTPPAAMGAGGGYVMSPPSQVMQQQQQNPQVLKCSVSNKFI